MDYSPEEIMQFVEEEDVKFIRLMFRDAFGIQKNISVMPGELKKAISGGIGINARRIAGFEDNSCSNLYLKPDLGTIAILPWRPESGRVVRMFCDVYDCESRPCKEDTRVILQDAVAKAKKAGISFKFGSKSEFYLFKLDDEGVKTLIPYDEAGYMDIAPLDKGENIRREICLTMEEMGLKPERSHHEQGPGQNEIDFHYGDPLNAADNMSTFLMAVGTIAGRNGLYADFSPKPVRDKPGNGYHITIYAKNESGEDVGRYVAAGILDKIRDITLFLNPAETSYRRFGTNSAPDSVDWSEDNRSSLMYVTERNGMIRTELRSPDALSNPYLAYSLLIEAGLHGIDNRLLLPEMSADETDKQLLPQSLTEAAEVAGKSEFIKSVLPDTLIKEYTLRKR
ncbi:MAG: glutamine synthetase [Eubacterium sp.]|nr:glutamine synthetase [Eubacterium sp.]